MTQLASPQVSLGFMLQGPLPALSWDRREDPTVRSLFSICGEKEALDKGAANIWDCIQSVR